MLDYVIPFNKDHLRRRIGDYVRYYHEDRIHDSLDKDAPLPRAVETKPAADATLISLPRLGGLHHRYAVPEPRSQAIAATTWTLTRPRRELCWLKGITILTCRFDSATRRGLPAKITIVVGSIVRRCGSGSGYTQPLRVSPGTCDGFPQGVPRSSGQHSGNPAAVPVENAGIVVVWFAFSLKTSPQYISPVVPDKGAAASCMTSSSSATKAGSSSTFKRVQDCRERSNETIRIHRIRQRDRKGGTHGARVERYQTR